MTLGKSSPTLPGPGHASGLVGLLIGNVGKRSRARLFGQLQGRTPRRPIDQLRNGHRVLESWSAVQVDQFHRLRRQHLRNRKRSAPPRCQGMRPPLMEARGLSVDNVPTTETSTHARSVQILRTEPASRLGSAVKAALEDQKVGKQVRRKLRLALQRPSHLERNQILLHIRRKRPPVIQIPGAKVASRTIRGNVLHVLHRWKVKGPLGRVRSNQIVQNGRERHLGLQVVPLDSPLEDGLLRKSFSLVDTEHGQNLVYDRVSHLGAAVAVNSPRHTPTPEHARQECPSKPGSGESSHRLQQGSLDSPTTIRQNVPGTFFARRRERPLDINNDMLPRHGAKPISLICLQVHLPRKTLQGLTTILCASRTSQPPLLHVLCKIRPPAHPASHRYRRRLGPVSPACQRKVHHLEDPIPPSVPSLHMRALNARNVRHVVGRHLGNNVKLQQLSVRCQTHLAHHTKVTSRKRVRRSSSFPIRLCPEKQNHVLAPRVFKLGPGKAPSNMTAQLQRKSQRTIQRRVIPQTLLLLLHQFLGFKPLALGGRLPTGNRLDLHDHRAGLLNRPRRAIKEKGHHPQNSISSKGNESVRVLQHGPSNPTPRNHPSCPLLAHRIWPKEHIRSAPISPPF